MEKAAVTAIDGRSLGDVVDQKGPRLFHSNVRYYLRRQNRVNKAMLETLDDPDKRQAFWLYNNGITIVAEEFRFETADDATTLLATNPQIVNGAQTSSVLRERRAHLTPGDVSVQARIIAVTSDAQGRDALEKISEYTNSQSPVRAGDLRSNDRRHKTLQSAFGMLAPPVFYERRRGEWLSLTAAAKAAYQGGRVTKEDIGQRYLSYIGRPAEAITKKDAIFGGELEPEAFDTSVSAQVYMLADALYRQADELMKESNSEKMLGLVPGFSMKVSPEADAPTQLAALRRMRKLACAHATALAREVLRARYHEVGDARAKSLRDRLADEADPTSNFIWRQVFKAIRQWMSAQADKSALKANMQRPEAVEHMRANLLDALADANLDELPALSS